MEGLMLFAVSLFTVTASVLGQYCHPDWLYHNESCYGFGEDPVTWGDAEVTCLAFDARLAEIEDTTENEWLKSIASNKSAEYYWIGGTDIFNEGAWEWVSSRLPIVFTDWAPGEPGDSGQGQDCLCLDDDHGYRWNDNDCESKHNFICEAAPMETIVGKKDTKQ